uniref:Uncharacterized protein n=1 Tax=Amphiprion percula TaxID=161767 RepID=A0A3P8S9G2_AMPPE
RTMEPYVGLKLNVLVNKLHDYLAHSAVEDSSGTITSDQRRIQAGKSKAKSRREAMESSSSSSDEQDDDSGSEGSDQKMKPITEGLALLGAAAFQQSSGESLIYHHVYI